MLQSDSWDLNRSYSSPADSEQSEDSMSTDSSPSNNSNTFQSISSRSSGIWSDYSLDSTANPVIGLRWSLFNCDEHWMRYIVPGIQTIRWKSCCWFMVRGIMADEKLSFVEIFPCAGRQEVLEVNNSPVRQPRLLLAGREHPHPLVALSIAVVFNQLALQKKVLRKSAAVAQSVAFAQRYAELRSGGRKGSDNDVPSSCAAQQEIYYNIGRIYHQANVLHLATEYYERALAVQHPLIKEHDEILGLQHEVAYNLHLIYRNSGNKWKARQCLMRYCVV